MSRANNRVTPVGHTPNLLLNNAPASGYSTLLEYLCQMYPRTLSAFDCDQATINLRKKESLGRLYGPKLVSIDLETEITMLPRRLEAAGFKKKKRTLFVMEGVLYYFKSATAMERLVATISELCRLSGGFLIFDIYTIQAPSLAKGAAGAIKSSGLTANFELPSIWIRRMERFGFTVRKFANLAWLNDWEGLLQYRSKISSCLFVAERQAFK